MRRKIERNTLAFIGWGITSTVLYIWTGIMAAISMAYLDHQPWDVFGIGAALIAFALFALAGVAEMQALAAHRAMTYRYMQRQPRTHWSVRYRNKMRASSATGGTAQNVSDGCPDARG